MHEYGLHGSLLGRIRFRNVFGVTELAPSGCMHGCSYSAGMAINRSFISDTIFYFPAGKGRWTHPSARDRSLARDVSR
jgi:hypothetical protein